ncbi:hypothetical protein DINM_005458 [Dirofilaria immitis]|nr:hypothetical protein [Dirofilaria immitis]
MECCCGMDLSEDEDRRKIELTRATTTEQHKSEVIGSRELKEGKEEIAGELPDHTHQMIYSICSILPHCPYAYIPEYPSDDVRWHAVTRSLIFPVVAYPSIWPYGFVCSPELLSLVKFHHSLQALPTTVIMNNYSSYEKFAFLVPSVQAAICLLFAAICSGSSDIIHYAEDALINVLRCDPQILYPYMNTVHNLVTGSNSGHEKRNPSSSSLVAPPTSESPHTPSLTPPHATAAIPGVALSLMCSQHTSPESSNQGVGDDSGFISGFQFGNHNVGGSKGNSSMYSRRRLRRSINVAHLNCIHRSYENMDNGVIAYYHANEDDFLSSY